MCCRWRVQGEKLSGVFQKREQKKVLSVCGYTEAGLKFSSPSRSDRQPIVRPAKTASSTRLTLNDSVLPFVLGNFGFGLQRETDFIETMDQAMLAEGFDDKGKRQVLPICDRRAFEIDGQL